MYTLQDYQNFNNTMPIETFIICSVYSITCVIIIITLTQLVTTLVHCISLAIGTID